LAPGETSAVAIRTSPVVQIASSGAIRCSLLENGAVGSIPVDAKLLTLEEALTYFHQWTPADRTTARTWIETTGVTDFYVPPSGGYVAGHGGPNRSAYRDMAVNGLTMHVGFLHAWPNEAEAGGDERIELSSSRSSTIVTSRRGTSPREALSLPCPQCFVFAPMTFDECESCGYDLAAYRAANRAANRARWEELRRRRGEAAESPAS
jgi:hypothetical protein